VCLEALTSYPSDNFLTPSGIVTADVDVVSGYRAHDGYPSRSESFAEGTIAEGQDPIHAKIAVCKNDGKLASPIDVAKGDTEEREFIVLKAPTQLGEADKKRWQDGFDAWISTQSDSRYYVPTEPCSSSAEDVLIKVKQPADQSRINSNNLDWEVEIISNKKPDKVEIFVDGLTAQTLTQSPWKSTLNLADGTYTLKFKARVEGGKEAESGDIRIGVNKDWNAVPTPTPTATVFPTP